MIDSELFKQVKPNIEAVLDSFMLDKFYVTLDQADHKGAVKVTIPAFYDYISEDDRAEFFENLADGAGVDILDTADCGEDGIYIYVGDNEELEENMENRKPRMREAVGNVDKLYGLFDKAKSAIEKAANAVLDVTDALDDILLEATAIGGKIEEIVPSHVESMITKLTQIADNDLNAIISGDGQSSLEGLKDLVGSIPYRDLKPETKEERISKISMRPNLSEGPQSAVMSPDKNAANTPTQYQESTEHPEFLNFEALRESGEFAQPLETTMDGDYGDLNGALYGYQSPIDTMQMVNQNDLLVNDDYFHEDDLPEDFDPEIGVSGTLSMDAINIPRQSESMDMGALDFTNLNESFTNI